MEHSLKDFFGFTKFRPFQKEIIQKVLDGRDCLVVMATGSGKSLCYQLPPLISKKSAIVISPLLSLMMDQVMALKQRGINSEYLGSTQSDSSVSTKAGQGNYDILFMTPEKALGLSNSFWKGLARNGLSLLAVDEAHCISEWGHDFRKEYQQLYKLREVLPNVPFLALTATATERVRGDIKRYLNLDNIFEVVSTFDRPNLFYGAKYISRSQTFREELAREVLKDCRSGGSTIIYCTTIKDVEEVTETLTQSGIDARGYHAQMRPKDRETAHRAFAHDEIQIIVATVAFGMGIDKPDIRRVIHYGCPKSLESYYQESGRCGRDGLPSSCWLYYSRADFGKADYYTAEAETEARKKVILDVYHAAEKYCRSSTCRRKYILEYFGEIVPYDNCGNCDNCVMRRNVQERDMSEEVHLLLSSVDLCGGRFGIVMPIDVLRGSRSKKVLENKFDELPLYGLGSSKTSNWWKALSDELLEEGYLKETRRDMYRFVSVGPVGKIFLQNASSQRVPIMIIPNPEMRDEESKQSGVTDNRANSLALQQTASARITQSMSEQEAKLCESLLKMRANLAKRNATAPYAVCSEITLQNLAKARPSSRARLLNIEGVNQWLVGKHGDEILRVIKEKATELELPLDSAERTIIESQKVPNSVRGYGETPPPAKVEAWEMWEKLQLTISEIANLPERPRPIKFETVAEYILDCCKAGYELNWQRFYQETGFKSSMLKEIEAGVARVGCVDKLKPIKEQVPEHVSYLHLKIFRTMQELSLPLPDVGNEDGHSREEHATKDSENGTQIIKTSGEVHAKTDSANICNEEAEMVSNGNQESDALICDDSQVKSELPWSNENYHLPSTQKRAPVWRTDSNGTTKLVRTEDGGTITKAYLRKNLTEESLMDWLSERDGASIRDMLVAFRTRESSLDALLKKLEEDFLIYKRNDIYRVI